MRRITIVLLLALAVRTDAIIMRHDREAARYVELGSRYPAVGMIGDQVTCTLIAPRWVLSAAHTIEDYFNPLRRPFVTLGGKRYDVDKVVLHPRRVSGAVDSDADVVLLRLAQPVEGITPVLLYDRDDEPGKIVTIVGYGETGNGLTGATNERGKPFAALNKVEAVFEHSLVVTFDTPPAGLDLEGIGGPGDSGCPALLEDGGKLYTVGIGSFNSGDTADHTASHYATLDAFARVSAHRRWILDTIAADPPTMIPMFGSYVRTKTIPSTPAGKAAGALVAAFNTARTGAIADFYRTYGRRRAEQEIQQKAAEWQELFDRYGNYEVLGFKEAGPYDIAVFVRAGKGNLGRAIGLQLDRAGEHRITRIVMADADEPKE